MKPSLAGYPYTNYSGYTAYTAQITSTGWCNIDRYSEETTIARQSTVYTDRQTGRKATLTYQPVSIQLLQSRQYNRIYVYLLPDKLNSFMRLSDSTGQFAERINQLMTYRLVCIGYKDEKAFFYTQADIQSRNYTDIPLNPISDSILDQRLDALGNRTQALDLRQETHYFQFEIHDQKRQQRNQALRDLTDKLYRAFFPCFYMDAPEQYQPKPAAPSKISSVNSRNFHHLYQPNDLP